MIKCKKILLSLLFAGSVFIHSFCSGTNTMQIAHFGSSVAAPACNLAVMWGRNLRPQKATVLKLVACFFRISEQLAAINLQKGKSPSIDQLYWITHYLISACQTSHELATKDFTQAPDLSDPRVAFSNNILIKLYMSNLLLLEMWLAKKSCEAQAELLWSKDFENRPDLEFLLLMLRNLSETAINADKPLELNMLHLGIVLSIISWMHQVNKKTMN
ncbi:MAG: hypothetical protein H6679_00120 [Epsilonproteobacteria bacterium]|nr:hypothetical protein [Campylobacterota bacterium]